MKQRRAFLKEERQIQIVNHAARAAGDDMRQMFTVSDVARWLDMSATQARHLLTGLVKQNIFVIDEEPYPGVCGKRKLYSFSEQYISDCELGKFAAKQRAKRTIKVNGQQTAFEVQ